MSLRSFQPVVLRPAAGLANRMRAIDSAIALCRHAGRPLEIVWFQDHALRAPFHALFEPFEVPQVSLREAAWHDYLTYDIPYRRRNLKLPALYQWLRFPRACRMGLQETNRRCRENESMELFQATSRRCHVASGSQLVPTEDRFAMFRPIASIQQRIQSQSAAFDRNRCIGVHIRRGDHRQATENSPVALFVDHMRRELDAGQCDCFHLATDSEEARTRLREAFGSRIITLDRPTDRQSVEGMQDAVVDLYVLAECRKIIGSCGSTFGETAAWMNDIPYTEVRKPGEQCHET